MRKLILGVAILGLVGCGMPDAAQPTPTTTNPPGTTTPVDESSDRSENAIADLAERLDIDRNLIRVDSDEEVTWPDGSMGCPDPGMMYTQALVEGYRIVLSVDGTEYRYHGAHGSDPFLCERTGL